MKKLQPSKIIDHVSRYYSIPISALEGRWRKREVVLARQMVMFLLRTYTSMSLKDVGETFNRDHTTVIYSVDTVKDICDTDEKVRRDRNILMMQLNNHIS